MRKRVKIYGERNTSTNYLSKLIALNLDATEIPGTAPPRINTLQTVLPGNEFIRDFYFKLAYSKTLGWKHTRVKPLSVLRRYRLATDRTAFVTITKNPYSWLLSLHQHPYHQYYVETPEFEVFLTTPWKTIRRDNVPARALTPIELWNVKNRSYVQSGYPQLLNLTSEEILGNAQHVIQTISDRFAIPMKTSGFVNYERSTKEAGKTHAYYRDYYLCERWKDKLSDEAIGLINESVDADLMARFGYRMLPSHAASTAPATLGRSWCCYTAWLPLLVNALSEFATSEAPASADRILSWMF